VEERTGSGLTCLRCGRSLARCAFCETTECPYAICYADLVVALGTSIPPLHAHGG
jgi:hypothetical protein